MLCFYKCAYVCVYVINENEWEFIVDADFVFILTVKWSDFINVNKKNYQLKNRQNQYTINLEFFF